MSTIRDGHLYVTVTYVGLPFAGKTTNIQQLHSRLRPEYRSKLVLNGGGPQHDGLLWFEATFPDLKVKGMPLRAQFCTVSGVGRDAAKRTSILGTDALVFVADSRAVRRDDNRGALEVVRAHLHSVGRPFSAIPIVMQYNRRDTPENELLPIDQLDRDLNSGGAPAIEAVAPEGKGVMDTCKTIVKVLVTTLIAGESSARRG